MLLVLLFLLVVLSISLGFNIGKANKIETRSYDKGYKDGVEAMEKLEQYREEIKDFPTTLDGKFFSTDAAIKQLSKEGDK